MRNGRTPFYTGLRGVNAVLLCSSLLGGCVAAPSVPPRSTVTEVTQPAEGAAVSGDAAPTQWWRLYNEPALDALVTEALTNNRDLRVAEANLLKARAILGEARGDRIPQTELSAGVGYGSTLQDQIAAAAKGVSSARTGTRYDLGADISWELDLFGRLRSNVRAARADVRASAALEDGVRISIAAGVTGAWLDACGFAHRADVARQSLALAERGRDTTERLRAAGATNSADVLRADALVAQARAAIPMLDAARLDALAELAVLTGHPPTEIAPAAAACRTLPQISAIVPVGDGRTLLRRRPDVRAAEQRLAAGTARIGIAVSDLYPRIAIGGMAADSAGTPSDLGNRNNLVWRFGPLLSWSFPNVSAARARLRYARAAEAGALAEFDGAILTALKEVNQRAEDYAALLHRQSALRDALDRSQHADRLTRIQRAAGAATALEALDADRTVIEAQANLASVDRDVAAAQVALFKALGGGWELAPVVRLPTPDRSATAATSNRFSK